MATKYTDASGQVSLTAGKGDMLVWASDKGTFGFFQAILQQATGIDIDT